MVIVGLQLFTILTRSLFLLVFWSLLGSNFHPFERLSLFWAVKTGSLSSPVDQNSFISSADRGRCWARKKRHERQPQGKESIARCVNVKIGGVPSPAKHTRTCVANERGQRASRRAWYLHAHRGIEDLSSHSSLRCARQHRRFSSVTSRNPAIA
jgi:hypothetical protein